MKHTESLPAFVPIPHVGTVPAYKVDPLNRAEVSALIQRADAYFKLSAQAWEDANERSNQYRVRLLETRHQKMGDNGAALLKPFGIKCDWPGLYPSFAVNGYHEYTTQAAVLAALGHPRNWLNA